jgi:hypothetical protein
MLQKHYTIEEGPFISNLAEDDEEKVELTLKAFSLEGRTLEAKTKLVDNAPTEASNIVQIDQLYSPLYLVKAIKEHTSMSLAEAKDVVDKLKNHFNDGTMVWLPLKVGNTPDCKFTKELWHTISDYMKSMGGNGSFKWHWV